MIKYDIVDPICIIKETIEGKLMMWSIICIVDILSLYHLSNSGLAP